MQVAFDVQNYSHNIKIHKNVSTNNHSLDLFQMQLASTSLYHNEFWFPHESQYCSGLGTLCSELCTMHYAAGVTINCPSIMLMLPLSPDQQIEDSPVSMSVALPAPQPKQNHTGQGSE